MDSTSLLSKYVCWINSDLFLTTQYTHDPGLLTDLKPLTAHRMPVKGGNVDFDKAENGTRRIFLI
jgi:hypothetical protein